MRMGTMLAVGALFVPAMAMAQSGPVAQQSSEQLVCRLTGDCEELPEATQELGEDRGFKIMQRTGAGASATPSSSRTNATSATRNSRSEVARVARPQSSTTAVSRANRNQLASAAAAVSPVSRGDLMITFVTGSADLTDQAKANAREFVKAMADPRLAGKRFRIEGHTDAVGGREYNLDLSQRRAQALVEFLASNGADRSLFVVEGYGFDKPLAGMNRMAAANRRVEAVRIN